MAVIRLVLFGCACLLCTPLTLMAQDGPLEEVRLQLMWKHQFQFAGYYMAEAKGFYADAGIRPRFIEFSTDQQPVDEVLNGNADFGIGRSSLVLDRARGRPVVALLAAFQESPLILMTRADSGIKVPADLRGKVVEMTSDAQSVSEIIAMLLKFGIRPQDLTVKAPTFDIEDLQAGRSDAIASYVSNEPFAMQQRGIAVNQIHPKDYGFPMYSDILFTSEQMTSMRPEFVERFRTATLQGWLYAFDHIEETAKLIHQHYNSQNRSIEALIYEGNSLKQLAFDNQGMFGTLKTERFQSMANVYRITDQITGDINLNGFIFCCSQQPDDSLILSAHEKQKLAVMPRLKICVEDNWMPFSGSTGGPPQGIMIEYTELILQQLGLRYQWQPVNSLREAHQLLTLHKCDLVSGVSTLLEHQEHMLFSRPFFSMPMVSASLRGESLQAIARKRGSIGLLEHHGMRKLLSRRYPGLKIAQVDSVSDGLRKVQNGNLNAFIDAEASIAYTLQKENISGMIIDPSLSDSWDLSLGLHPDNAILLALLERAMDNLDPKAQASINNRWLPLAYKPPIAPEDLEKLLLALAVITLFFGYRHYMVKKNNQRLERIVRSDPLTGTQNRFAMKQHLDLYMALAERNQQPLSLVYLDIDNFKQINDRKGHNYGDQVLIGICRKIETGVRKSDQFGRWGGEEFLIILPNTDLAGATRLAEKLRLLLKYAAHGELPLPTCSFGVAEWNLGESQDELLRRADNALYQAKYRGKDMVRQALFPIPDVTRPLHTDSNSTS